MRRVALIAGIVATARQAPIAQGRFEDVRGLATSFDFDAALSRCLGRDAPTKNRIQSRRATVISSHNASEIAAESPNGAHVRLPFAQHGVDNNLTLPDCRRSVASGGRLVARAAHGSPHASTRSSATAGGSSAISRNRNQSRTLGIGSVHDRQGVCRRQIRLIHAVRISGPYGAFPLPR